VNPASEEQQGPGGAGAAEPGDREPDNVEVRGSRFSKSADERQKMLKQRKDELLQQARRCGGRIGDVGPLAVVYWRILSLL